MCGRFTLTVDPAELREMLELGELPPDLQPRYNIAPTQAVPVVTSALDRKVEMFHWGLIPSWSKDPSMSGRMINARAESLHEKPAYRVPFARKRCMMRSPQWRPCCSLQTRTRPRLGPHRLRS